MNYIERLQKNLGFRPVQKIDPNTSEPKDKIDNFETGSIGQAAIPVTFIGLVNYLDANKIKPADLQTERANWISLIFAAKDEKITSAVAQYAGTTFQHARQEMEFIAKEAVRLIKENNDNQGDMHHFAIEQEQHALLYLPVSLHAGVILNNNPMDDNTAKMEGPISNLIHNIEKKFM